MTDTIVQEAREWVGTSFVPQQSVKGHGCDCKGLIAGIARELSRPEADHVHMLALDYNLARVPSDRLKVGMADLFDRVVGEPEPGDLLLLKVGKQPAHLAVCTEGGLVDGRAVHASVENGVRETRLRALLKIMPLDSVWRFRPCR